MNHIGMQLEKKRNKKIAVLTLYDIGFAPGARFRYEQYLRFLPEQNLQFALFPFFTEKEHKIIHSKTNLLFKFLLLSKCYFKRLRLICLISKFEYIFLFREIIPIGPALFEFIIAKILRKKIIYDFDDAIWMPQEGYGSRFKNFLKNPSKVNSIIRWSYKVSCGNEYLCEHSRKFNKNVVLNPTTIDTVNLHNRIKNQATNKIVIGWTGSHSTLMYLDPIVPVISKLEKEFDFDFVVICNKNPNYPLRSFKFLPWNKESEIDDLMTFNFGLMPLLEDKWTEGKCGFKALQYMALGMPAIVSPVGVNKVIVDHGIDGFCCKTETEWYEAIKTLIQNESIRTSMGEKAREKIVKQYSVESNKENFLNLFS